MVPLHLVMCILNLGHNAEILSSLEKGFQRPSNLILLLIQFNPLDYRS